MLTSPYAWQRLNRFAAAVGYRTLSEAAERLGITQSTLAIQINRLERDIGGPLLERAERGRPMIPPHSVSKSSLPFTEPAGLLNRDTTRTWVSGSLLGCAPRSERLLRSTQSVGNQRIVDPAPHRAHDRRSNGKRESAELVG